MKYPDKYLYPAVLTYEDGYDIAVTFPDLPGCATSGKDELDAIECAKEALGGHLWCMEEDNDEIPEPTQLRDVAVEENERAILIEVYMPSVRLSQEYKSVNRTVTIPAWLNAVALEHNVNFSQTLQNALIEQLHLQK